MTARRPFTMFAAAIFLLIALAHLYRLVVGFDVSVAGTHISQSLRWIALVFTGLLAAMLFREARR
ncbi:hypothetical protein H9L14_08025 [Sphingomonas sediminicola]|uniref:Uncharacterized protein n=1 Tax=Sphingomonas sediminicola TaxID=386874 RepID=A0ABX6T524_9SPHN|nr:hypothetical protein [Sphingomonas sediminicola]QNP44735.1 hypothetical protein H9L14_08025 [Sphingomonas sediminicola]